MTIYYFTTFRKETKNEDSSKFLVSVILFLLLYVATFILIFNILNFYKSFNKNDNFMEKRSREDNFARLLARRAPDPDNVINPLFDRSPQFLRGPFGPNNPRANQIAYTFFND
jgi:ABC-type sugar transport system permease subunit